LKIDGIEGSGFSKKNCFYPWRVENRGSEKSKKELVKEPGMNKSSTLSSSTLFFLWEKKSFRHPIRLFGIHSAFGIR